MLRQFARLNAGLESGWRWADSRLTGDHHVQMCGGALDPGFSLFFGRRPVNRRISSPYACPNFRVGQFRFVSRNRNLFKISRRIQRKYLGAAHPTPPSPLAPPGAGEPMRTADLVSSRRLRNYGRGVANGFGGWRLYASGRKYIGVVGARTAGGYAPAQCSGSKANLVRCMGRGVWSEE